MARVRGPIAAGMSATSRLNVAGSMSTNTGVAPTWRIDSAVAKKENGVVMTSSPGPIPRQRRPMTRASVPLFNPTACFTPRKAATSCSKAATSLPRMKRPLLKTRSMAGRSSSHSSSTSACRSSMGTDTAVSGRSAMAPRGRVAGGSKGGAARTSHELTSRATQPRSRAGAPPRTDGTAVAHTGPRVLYSVSTPAPVLGGAELGSSRRPGGFPTGPRRPTSRSYPERSRDLARRRRSNQPPSRRVLTPAGSTATIVSSPER